MNDNSSPFDACPFPSLERGDLRIEWEYIGEGYNGEWDEDDPEDEALLRFTVYTKPTPHFSDASYYNVWEQLDDGSYCTLMSYDTPYAILERALELIYEQIEGTIYNHNYKRTLERLSWLSPLSKELQ